MTLDLLLSALPEQNDLAPLRQALLRASAPDASLAWSRAGAYATFDKRVITAESVRAVVAEAAAAEHARIDSLYAALGEVLELAANGDHEGACARLIAIGEAMEGENPQGSIAFYDVAARYSEGFANRRFRTHALRRLGRAYGSIGDVDVAIAYFRSAFDQATAAGDAEAQILVAIGHGVVLGFQGRSAEAIEMYRDALERCAENYPRLRAHLAINLAAVLREAGDLDEAAAQLAAGTALWAELVPAEHSVWFNNRGLLSLTRGETDAAEAMFRQALETAPDAFDRSMVLDNLAELSIVRGNLEEAEAFARQAEQHALTAGSPRALAEIYTRLGKIFRLRSDLNGVTFFEKALELCRSRTYPLIEANAYLEYGIFRRILGDREDARSHFERAQQIAADIGTTQLHSAAASELADL
ncbi:MAG TPA: tetratricopeptide repeat protein [Longimicrobiales bacterium]|nr:tetratricopeptide repeat protein [Longimicrobiales bacterium]